MKKRCKKDTITCSTVSPATFLDWLSCDVKLAIFDFACSFTFDSSAFTFCINPVTFTTIISHWHSLYHFNSQAPCGLGGGVEQAHLVPWPSVVRGNWTRLVLLCCVLGCLLFFCLYWVCLSVFSCTVLFVSISQVIGREDRLRNDLYCVEWGVKLYSIHFNSQIKWRDKLLQIIPVPQYFISWAIQTFGKTTTNLDIILRSQLEATLKGKLKFTWHLSWHL